MIHLTDHSPSNCWNRPDFVRIWRLFLLILPLVHIVGSLFGLPQLSVVRLVLVGTTGVLLLLSREVTGHWRIVPNEPGLVGFLLFVAANLFSAVHTLNYESVFRTITYLEPALFFILTYQVVRRDSGNMRQVVRVIALGGGAGLVVNVTADKVVRILPPLVIREEEAKQLVSILAPVVKSFLAEAPAAAAA